MKLFKNRTVLGIFCIAVSLIICFAITPLVNAGLSKKVTIVRFNRQVNEGEEITRSMLDEVEVGNHNLPENVIRNIADVEGKYLTTTVYAGDYILTDKISDEPAAENKYLYSLNGEKQAMSITINTFAEGLSGKLKSGDIVSVIAPDYLGSGETVIPVELKYVEVIAVTAKSGYDMMMDLLDSSNLPTAVFAANDAIALGAMKAIKERGYKIPRDISIVGFNDEESSTFITPPLTTIHAPSYDMGQHGANLVYVASNLSIKTPLKAKIPCPLVIRESCARVKENC